MNNKFCRYCGTENNFDYIYCKRCGRPLSVEGGNNSTSNEGSSNGYQNSPYGNAPYENGNAPYGNGYPNGNSPYGNGFPNGNPYGNAPFFTIPESIDGVNTEDVAIFLGKDSRKYLPIFANIEAKKTSGVNLLVLLLSALVSPFFAAFWFMQKRMNKIGLFLFLLLSAFQFGYLIATFSVLGEVFSSFTIDTLPEELMVIIASKLESNSMLYALSNIYQIVSLAVAVISGIFANKWYKNHVISTIKSITAENEEGYKHALVQKGGTRNGLWVALLILTIVAIFTVSMIFTFSAIA